MSETTRTDAHLKAQVHTYSPSVEPDFARQLERELNAASKERDDALMMLGMYRMKSDEQQDRIKRLEEAGDRLADPFNVGEDDIKRWNKAKEAKL